MKVIQSKRKNIKQFDQKSEQTTAINSRTTNSRRNSSFLTVSKEGQTLILPDQDLDIGQQTKRNRKCLNLTINQNKSMQPKTERVNKPSRKWQLVNFNFCQQVSDKQNFYTQIIDVDKAPQVLNPPIKTTKQNRLKAICLGKRMFTLNSPKSPINELTKLLDENQDDLVVGMENLMVKH